MSLSERLPLLDWLFSTSFIWLICVNASAAFAQEECLSLSNSKACPAFRQYSVDLADMRQQYPELMANVTNVQSFDERLLNVHTSREFLVTQLGCNNTTSPQQQQRQQRQHIVSSRYTLTHQCAILTQSRNCNKNASLPQLCQTTCNTWAVSVTNDDTVSRICNSNSSSSTITQLIDQCANTFAYNGTAPDACISGSVNEPDYCGFQWDVNSACQYCRGDNNGKNDPCCSSVLSACDDLNDGGLHSSGAISAIALGSLMLVALLCGLTFYFGFLRKKKQRESINSEMKDDNYIAYGLEKDTNNTSQQTLFASGYNSDGGEKIKEDRHPQSDPSQKQQSPRTIAASMVSENLYAAVHVYPPQQKDELMLYPGDTIMVAIQFDDGWGFGYNLSTGEKGALPMVCVEPFIPTADNSDDRSFLAFQQSKMVLPGVGETAATVAAAADNNNTMNDSSVVLLDSPMDSTTHMF